MVFSKACEPLGSLVYFSRVEGALPGCQGVRLRGEGALMAHFGGGLHLIGVVQLDLTRESGVVRLGTRSFRAVDLGNGSDL